MKRNHIHLLGGLGLLLVLPLVHAASPLEAQTASGSDMAFFAQPVDTAQLGNLRGGSELVLNHMTLDGTTADNTASHVVTGTNLIGSGAFASASGIPVVIQNSGANVLIQNAVILNLQVQ